MNWCTVYSVIAVTGSSSPIVLKAEENKPSTYNKTIMKTVKFKDSECGYHV